MRFGGWKQTSCWSLRPKSIAKYFNRREAGQHDQLGKMKASAFTSLSSNLPSVMASLGTWGPKLSMFLRGGPCWDGWNRQIRWEVMLRQAFAASALQRNLGRTPARTEPGFWDAVSYSPSMAGQRVTRPFAEAKNHQPTVSSRVDTVGEGGVSSFVSGMGAEGHVQFCQHGADSTVTGQWTDAFPPKPSTWPRPPAHQRTPRKRGIHLEGIVSQCYYFYTPLHPSPRLTMQRRRLGFLSLLTRP